MEQKTGLVLEGGAMRGMFTAGVLDVLMENDIFFDTTVGVSAGATFGCNYKSKQIGRTIRYNKRYAHDKRFCSIWSLIKTGDLYGAEFCYHTLPDELDIFDFRTFASTPMNFFVVATDCVSGEPVYKELKTCDNNDLEWMRASASMPLVSNIVKIDDYKLLDGGMADPIPLKYCESLGCNKNLVVLTQPKEYRKKPNKLMWLIRIALKKYPGIINAMEKRHLVYNQQKDYVFEKAQKGEIFVICPEKSLGMSRTEKNVEKLQSAYDEGRRIAKTNLTAIKNFLFLNT